MILSGHELSSDSATSGQTTSTWCVASDAATRSRLDQLLSAFPSLSVSQPLFQQPQSDTAFVLKLDGERMMLFVQSEPRWSGTVVDFMEGAMAHRRRQAVGGEHVVKAVWGRAKGQLTVVDATAGLGRDGFLLASSGADVTACERHPAVAFLLADGLWRAQQEPAMSDVMARLHFHHGSTLGLLEGIKPDVVYLDPMFPEREKTALVKKEMRAFKGLVGEDEDAGQLFEAACRAARKRVVVKRPASGEPLVGNSVSHALHSQQSSASSRMLRPAYSIEGKANRFDVYVFGDKTQAAE